MTEARRIPQPARERRGIHTLALLVVLALVLRALVPQGYMPALHGERKGFVLPLVLCTQQGMVEIAPDASGRLPTHLADSLGEELAAEITAQFTAQFKADFETSRKPTPGLPMRRWCPHPPRICSGRCWPGVRLAWRVCSMVCGRPA